MSFELSLSAARGGVALAGELAAHTLAAFSNDELVGARSGTTMFRDPRDAWALATYTTAMLAFYFATQWALFPPLGAALGLTKHRTKQKFAASLRELLFYSTSLAMSFRFLWRYPWMHDYAEVWTVGEQEEVQLELKFMYLFEISWYVAGMAYMVLDVPNRKKDFAEMMLHHGITAILTTFSYKIGHLRCGFVIILLHNVADPPLHLAKCLNYVCKRLGLQDVFFAIFALLFIGARLAYLPQVIWSALAMGPGYTRGDSWRDNTPMEMGLIFLLIALLPIHVYWISLILKMALKLLKGNELGDDSREKDSDDED